MSQSELINTIFLLFTISSFLLIIFSGLLQKFWLPSPLIALLIGFLAGPYGFNFYDPSQFEHKNLLLKEMARFTLAIALMDIAMRLPKVYWKKHFRFIVGILTLGMILLFSVSTLLIWWLLPFPFLVAALLGAIITPTDPVVSTPVVTGPIAEKNVPKWILQNVSAESGSNDGLGMLFVLLPITLMHYGFTSESISHWLLHGLLKEITVAIIVGFIMGWLAIQLLRYSEKYDDIKTSYLGFAFIFPVVVLTLVRWLGADGILAAFVAGAVFDQGIPKEHQQFESDILETISKFFMISIFIVIGLFLPIEQWGANAWLLALAWALILIARRAVTIMILGKFLRPTVNFSEMLFLSWFAPVGVAAVYYVTHAQEETSHQDLWSPISLCITVSVLLHGLTAAPFAKLFGKYGNSSEQPGDVPSDQEEKEEENFFNPKFDKPVG